MLTPRLIAPHRNTGYERTLAPEEAIALVTQGRVQDLEWYIKKGSRSLPLSGGHADTGSA
ncbi:hypothetical protein ACFWH4_31940 [Streptomyces sp. NPDC127091]|uniref:hypothetical protein n=1 Tax=Streptomyces sp. NPDC127091 TaxID=3347134 RepID=UPI003669D4F7